MMQRKKVDLISECCKKKAVVKDVYVKGAPMGSYYYYCTGCHMPCELTGYVAGEEQENIDQ